jgi:hypothetical protein
VSFEDSQVDRFIPYASPSVLHWHSNLAINNNNLNNISEIEEARGNGNVTSSVTQLTQLPIGE